MDQYDVIIVGGGLNGASLAVALAPLDLRVALLDAFTPGEMQEPAYDDRSVALSYGSSLIYQGMGIWESIRERATPILDIHVSDRGHLGAARFNAEKEGLPALGYLIENQRLVHELYQQLKASDIDLLSPATVESMQQQPEFVELGVQLQDQQQTLSAKLVIGCDGTGSGIRERAGIAFSRKDYGQSAVVANVTPEKPHQNEAFERFTEAGPIALLPLTDNRCSLVWTHPGDAAQDVLQLSDEDFLHSLNQAFGYRLGRFIKVGRRAAFPLALTRASATVGKRVVLIGNAAQTLHPVAGQGLNLGLRDIAEIVEQLSTDADDPGAAHKLEAYAKSREKDRKTIINYTDSLVSIFSNDWFLLGHARAGGLMAIDRIKPLQRWLTRRSMGFHHRKTRLARGLPARRS